MQFFKNKTLKTASREVKISTEKIRANKYWLNKNQDKIRNWLRNVSDTKGKFVEFLWKWCECFLYIFFILVKLINYRLPTDLKPYFYDIKIKPYIGTEEIYGNRSFTFDGWVNVSFTCLNQTKKIVLHIKDIEIKDILLYVRSYYGMNEIGVEKSFKYDEELEFLTINMNTECAVYTNYTLHIAYIGQISDSLAGFYRSSYVDANGTTH